MVFHTNFSWEMGAICNLLFISGGNNGNILVKCYALTWEMFQAFSFECYVIWLQMSSHFDICAVQLVKFGVLTVLLWRILSYRVCLVENYQHFRGICCIHIWETKHLKVGSADSTTTVTFIMLHGIPSQKMFFFSHSTHFFKCLYVCLKLWYMIFFCCFEFFM